MSDDFLDSTQEVTVTGDRDAVLRRIRTAGHAIVVILVGGRPGERAVLTDETFVIGRGADVDLHIHGDAVSRVHAHIEKRDGAHVLVDRGSTNGSFINYQRVTERVLRDGDQIQIGQSMLKYLSGDNIETAYHEEFRLLVRRDALTGALNRATFDEEVQVAVSKAMRLSAPLSLILFDLDHFKSVNDTHGHTAGDLVLSRVGETVLRVAEPKHLFARIGGEEFAVVVAGGSEEAHRIAEELRAAIEKLTIQHEGKNIPVTASFGVATKTGATSTELLETADEKLYAAKESGRNRVCS